MSLSPWLKEFLSRRYILDMIDNKKWNEFYDTLAKFDWNNINDVTDFLIHTCDIDPLPYMSYVPANYRRNDASIITLETHDGIKIIYERAFMDCLNLETVIINPSCNRVYEYVFKGCKNLRKVHILGAKTRIDPLAFCFLDNIEFYINRYNEDMISLFRDTFKYDVHVMRGTKA